MRRDVCDDDVERTGAVLGRVVVIRIPGLGITLGIIAVHAFRAPPS